MSKLPNKISKQTEVPIIGTSEQGLNALNQNQFPGQIQQSITNQQNIPNNIGTEEEKNTKSNYYF